MFRKLPRVDAVFVPGGDPGHTQPKYLMALLEKQTALLQRYHPEGADVGVTAKLQRGMDGGVLRHHEDGAALAGGIVFGPQNRTPSAALRERIPKRYPIRFYPDITHSLWAQFPARLGFRVMR